MEGCTSQKGLHQLHRELFMLVEFSIFIVFLECRRIRVLTRSHSKGIKVVVDVDFHFV